MDAQRFQQEFGFTPTDDFRRFWEFACETSPSAPLTAFHDAANVVLAGPFEALAGRFDRDTAHYEPCLHWRYFGDPPEFVTVLTGGTDGLHWGYVVDGESNALGVAGYYAHDDVSLFEAPTSLFSASRAGGSEPGGTRRRCRRRGRRRIDAAMPAPVEVPRRVRQAPSVEFAEGANGRLSGAVQFAGRFRHARCREARPVAGARRGIRPCRATDRGATETDARLAAWPLAVALARRRPPEDRSGRLRAARRLVRRLGERRFSTDASPASAASPATELGRVRGLKGGASIAPRRRLRGPTEASTRGEAVQRPRSNDKRLRGVRIRRVRRVARSILRTRRVRRRFRRTAGRRGSVSKYPSWAVGSAARRNAYW